MNDDHDDLAVRFALASILNDDDGFVVRRLLPDGRALGVTAQIFNAKLTLSRSITDDGWEEAW